MLHHLLSEFMGTALMIMFGLGVHCDDVLKKTKYAGSGHLFAITTWAFGITVVLFIFGGVCINPAMALAQAILGMIPWSYFVPYVIAEMLDGLVGAIIILDYSPKRINAGIIVHWGVFCLIKKIIWVRD